MELLVNQEGKIYGWMSKTSIVYTLRRVGNTIEFWPTRDYPERSVWGQKVTSSQPKSGDYITVSGETYLMVFQRFSKGSDVTISPVPDDWDQPAPTESIYMRNFDDDYYAVDRQGNLLSFGGHLIFGTAPNASLEAAEQSAEIIRYWQNAVSVRELSALVAGDNSVTLDGVTYNINYGDASHRVTITPTAENYPYGDVDPEEGGYPGLMWRDASNNRRVLVNSSGQVVVFSEGESNYFAVSSDNGGTFVDPSEFSSEISSWGRDEWGNIVSGQVIQIGGNYTLTFTSIEETNDVAISPAPGRW